MNKIKTTLLRIVSVVFIVIVVASLAGCGSDPIVGRWENPDEVDRAGRTRHLVQLEFFSDGTYTSNRSNYTGDYSIDGDRIRLDGVLVEPLTFTFEVDGDTLIFYDDDGDVKYWYQRVG